MLLGVGVVVYAAPNIDATDKWAWNDIVSWIDFQYSSNPNVEVLANELRGYANSSVGFISLNCAFGPPGSNCTIPYKVVNDGDGNLSGWGWNDAIGWVSFNCDHTSDGTPSPDNTNTCATSNYQVTVDGSGNFSGFAWNDIIGWISFNCTNTGTCATSNYKVKTTATISSTAATVESSTYDAGSPVAFYSLMYRGQKPIGTNVKFQFASSNNENGPWSFIGPNGLSDDYYVPTGPDDPVQLSFVYHSNHRYFRYKAILESATWGVDLAPEVTDIIVTWGQ
ncbi:MAG TPA: hypothetical protein VJH70_00360 [Candidatus Paceibacterota bacterium]